MPALRLIRLWIILIINSNIKKGLHENNLRYSPEFQNLQVLQIIPNLKVFFIAHSYEPRRLKKTRQQRKGIGNL